MLKPRLVKPQDMDTLNEWMAARNLAYLDPANASHGYIIPGLAAGFLLLANGNIAFLENFVTNPIAPIPDRVEALRLVGLHLIKVAKEFDTKRLFVLTNKLHIAEMAINEGFASLGQFTVLEKTI